jgi:NAD(P)-dependent dehydrogenase (short-subunit alcohol dehydrogenase family)
MESDVSRALSVLGARVALITGANTGIGRVTAIELAREGFRLFLAGRSLERTRPVIEEISAMRAGAAPARQPSLPGVTRSTC